MVVYREDTGQFLNQARGESRSWTPCLEEAQVFPSAGRAKVAYNHATAWERRYAADHARRLAKGWAVSTPPRPIPPFAVRPVKVVLV